MTHANSKRGTGGESAIAPRNFTMTNDERVRAIATGPPAHLRRLRAIEDLEENIVRALVEHYEEALAANVDGATYARMRAPQRAIERLADLVQRHNRYYLIEANLPMHPRTGELIDRTGEPWRPLAPRTLEELLGRAKDRVSPISRAR
jgi:hypothetical protein